MPLDPTTLLRDCPEDQIGISIPSPLNARLDLLVERANTSGERTTRKELLAALLLDASDQGEELGLAVRRFRAATAADGAPGDCSIERVLETRPKKPGPRARRSFPES